MLERDDESTAGTAAAGRFIDDQCGELGNRLIEFVGPGDVAGGKADDRLRVIDGNRDTDMHRHIVRQSGPERCAAHDGAGPDASMREKSPGYSTTKPRSSTVMSRVKSLSSDS